MHGTLYNIGRTASAAVSPFVAHLLGWTMFLGVYCAAMAVLIAVAYWMLYPRVKNLVASRRALEGEPAIEAS